MRSLTMPLALCSLLLLGVSRAAAFDAIDDQIAVLVQKKPPGWVAQVYVLSQSQLNQGVGRGTELAGLGEALTGQGAVRNGIGNVYAGQGAAPGPAGRWSLRRV